MSRKIRQKRIVNPNREITQELLFKIARYMSKHIDLPTCRVQQKCGNMKPFDCIGRIHISDYGTYGVTKKGKLLYCCRSEAESEVQCIGYKKITSKFKKILRKKLKKIDIRKLRSGEQITERLKVSYRYDEIVSGEICHTNKRNRKKCILKIICNGITYGVTEDLKVNYCCLEENQDPNNFSAHTTRNSIKEILKKVLYYKKIKEEE